jgi:hypothetical protein
MSTLHRKRWNRREFAAFTIAAGMAGQASTVAAGSANSQAPAAARRVRTGVIGCGSVSHAYLPVLTDSPFVEVVSLCDIRHERAS